MTRDEYRKLIRANFTGNGWEYYADHINFYDVLKTVAVECFLRRDLVSDLAQETHRRMVQIKETGETDP